MRFRLAIAALVSVSALAEPPNPKLVERYRQMLAANPAEGVALERLWKLATESGQAEQLITDYEKADGFASRMVLGLLLRRASRDVEAEDAFKRAALLDANSPLPLLALAKLESDRTRPREAAAWLEKAAALLPKDDPRNADVLLQLGSAWFSAGEAAKAAEAWERTVALAPDDLDLRRRLAGVYAENLLPEPAVRHLEHIAERGQPSARAEALQQIAKLHNAAGKPGDAMKALERAVAFTAPDNWLRPELLGQMIRIAQRQHVEAELEARWREDAEKSHRDLGGVLRMVEFYERTANLEAQREWLEKVIALVPKNATHRLRLARLFVHLDRPDDAARLFDELLAAQPRNADLVLERARLDVLREDAAAARDRIAALLARLPDDAALRQRTLEFYQQHRLLDLVEEHLKAEAKGGAEDTVFALANFHFAQRRNADGLQTLQRLVRADDPPERQAALRHKIALALKLHGELAHASDAAGAATVLAPGVRDYHLLLGELRSTRLRFAEARASFEKAYALSKDESEQIEADGKVFETFRAEDPLPEPFGRRRVPASAAKVEGYIQEKLVPLARERGDAASWLRVARWKAWNNEKAPAQTVATKAQDIEPKNPAPREFLAKHAAANGDPGSAIMHLRALVEMNPAGREGYLREIARLELQRGNGPQALAIFTDLARANPGSADAIMDTANAHERAGQLPEAAAAWRRALAALPAQRKREASASLLRVLQQMGRHEEAAVLLLRAVDGTQDEKERGSRFDELLLHAKQHGQLDWLRAKLEERRKLRADDYFTAVALGRVLKLRGDKAAAFELFADAALAAPRQAEALPELVREAEELHRLDVAVRLQEQLTRLAAHERPDAFIKLAALYEKTGDLEGTERAWSRAVAKFPRDPDVVRPAADFHRQWGDASRAAVLLRKLAALDPANLRAASELGALEFSAGRFAEARDAFSIVLKLTKPAGQRLYPSDRGDGPWSERGAQMDFRTRRVLGGSRLMLAAGARDDGSFAAKPAPDTETRLLAVRRLAEIAQRGGGAAREIWIKEWEPSADAQATEWMWAMYFCGERARVLERIAKWMADEPGNAAHQQAFVWMALESAQFARLSAWLNTLDRPADERGRFTTAFSEFTRLRPAAITPAMLAELFPPGADAQTWEAAKALAGAQFFHEAVALGRRALELMPSHRALLGHELANWSLAANDAAGARELFALAADSEGESFASHTYAAIRGCWLLTPAAERAALAERWLGADAATVHGKITRTLLHGLSGETAKAEAALDSLVGMRPVERPNFGREAVGENAASRERDFLLTASAVLRNWELPDLAARLWEQALADGGLRSAQSRQKVPDEVDTGKPRATELWIAPLRPSGHLRAMEDQRDALRWLRGGRIERGALLAERATRQEGWSALANVLSQQRAHASAKEVRQRIWERAPQDPSALRELADACREAGDAAGAEVLRRRVLEQRINPGNDSTPRQFALELAVMMENRGALEEATRLIAEASRFSPNELVLQWRHAQLLLRMGSDEEAGAILRKLAASGDGTAVMRNGLAVLCEQQGQFAEALAVRERGGGGVDPRLPVLLFKNGRGDDALAALDKHIGGTAVEAACDLAEELALAGDVKGARSVLVATAGRVTDVRAQLSIRKKLLGLPGGGVTPEFAARMFARMRSLVEAQPELADEFYDFMRRHAARLGIGKQWADEIARSWDAGHGALAAGFAAMDAALSRGDAAGARRECEALLARADMTGALLARIDALLADAKETELRLLVAGANARRSWPGSQGMLDHVARLDEFGRREQAREVLTRHEWLVIFDGGAEALGRAWLSLGDAKKARGFAEAALRGQALVPSPTALALMARVQLAEKKLPAARLLLRRAFAEPGCAEHEAIIEYLEAAGALPRWRDAVAEFALAPHSEHALKRALFAHFEKHGRLADALALVASESALIEPSGGVDAPVTCVRLRALSVKTGGFAEIERALAALAASGQPDAPSELAALRADWALAKNEPALTHLERAAELCPATWEFSRRVAQQHLADGQPAKAREVLARFLARPGSAMEREAAFALWEKARAAAR